MYVHSSLPFYSPTNAFLTAAHVAFCNNVCPRSRRCPVAPVEEVKPVEATPAAEVEAPKVEEPAALPYVLLPFIPCLTLKFSIPLLKKAEPSAPAAEAETPAAESAAAEPAAEEPKEEAKPVRKFPKIPCKAAQLIFIRPKLRPRRRRGPRAPACLPSSSLLSKTERLK
ncbi:hypothetical protein BDZ97DRAFT_175968 [Flammula alnicola]|nr:hypothetical protein BDZ97DRAFT_175968 [Flammula alnicola]